MSLQQLLSDATDAQIPRVSGRVGSPVTDGWDEVITMVRKTAVQACRVSFHSYDHTQTCIYTVRTCTILSNTKEKIIASVQ